MKNSIIVALLALTVIAVACSRDYRTDLIGTWDAGKATLDKNMTVVIKDDGTMTAEITDLNMKPIKGTYRLDRDKIVFKFPTIDLSYTIVKLDRQVLVMKWNYARITWHRIK